MSASAIPSSLLKKVPFLSSIKPEHLKSIVDISKIRVFPARSMVFSKSEAAEHMFIVVSGRVKIFVDSSARMRKTFAYLTEGQFFGEMALLGGEPRSASAQAMVESKLLVISKADFKRLLISDPALTYFLLCSVAGRLRRCNLEVEGFLFRNVLGRAAKTLQELASSGGEAKDGGSHLREIYTHQELADLVGTAREPLTRALASLKRLDILQIKDGRFLIRDMNKLAEIAGG